MGYRVPPRPMAMTLWPKQGRGETVTEMIRQIMEEKLWLPIYEEGGLDALVKAGEIRPSPPTPTPNQKPMSDYL